MLLSRSVFKFANKGKHFFCLPLAFSLRKSDLANLHQEEAAEEDFSYSETLKLNIHSM